MRSVNINTEIINDLSTHISDIQARLEESIRQLCQSGEQQLCLISEETLRRQRIVDALEDAYRRCQRGGGACEELRRKLERARQALLSAQTARQKALNALAEYNSKSKIVREAVMRLASAGKITLQKLKNALDDYSAFSGLVASAILQASYVPIVSPISNNGALANDLSVTKQIYVGERWEGKNVLVFDHPQKSSENAIIKQGSARPDNFRGTCGLCAVGSVIRKAGICVDEGDMIDYATANGLCSSGGEPKDNGGTTADSLCKIMKGAAGIPSHASMGIQLEKLAVSVESGHGVIIGVNPYLLINPEWDVVHDSDARVGHWVVLESVVRDAATNEIYGYFIIDSNGDSASLACQFICADYLAYAYDMDKAEAVITDNIIW